jgi:AcrR family transcriptional regulator
VAVESLAARVGASKGSFYWHFKDRAALIEAAVSAWEESQTTNVIRDLQAVGDPRLRLRRLFGALFGTPTAARLELALTVYGYHPAVGPVVRRATSRRLGFLTEALGDIGFDASEARRRAAAAYSLHLGLFAVRDASRSAVPARRGQLDDYMNDLLELLVRL